MSITNDEHINLISQEEKEELTLEILERLPK